MHSAPASLAAALLITCFATLTPTSAAQSIATDPLHFCSWIGGSGKEEIRGVAADSAGNTLVAGYTNSLDLPVKNAAQASFAGGDFDCFVASFNSEGGLNWCTYLGGNSRELAYDLAVGPDDSVYIVGGTSSANFPRLHGPGLTLSGNLDGFVTRLSPDGELISSGLIGGVEFDSIRGCSVGIDGSCTVIGRTRSDESSFPVLVGPDLTYNELNNKGDAFVARVAADAQLEYCGYIGGAFADYGRSIAVDSDGTAYACGWTNSDETTFPTLRGPDLSYNGGAYDYGEGEEQYGDAFIARISPSGDRLQACGYFGGVQSDAAFGICMGPDDTIFVGGHTNTDELTFPVLRGPLLTYQGAVPGQPYGDGWVAQFSTDLEQTLMSGYVGGEASDRIWKINWTEPGVLYTCGMTRSFDYQYPHYNGGARVHFGDLGAATVSAIDTRQATILHTTVLGGSSDDMVRDVEIGPDGTVHIAGWSESGDFPVVRSSQPNLSAGQLTGWVARMSSLGDTLRTGNTRPRDESRPREMLRVNGSIGVDSERVVRVAAGAPVEVSLDAIGEVGDLTPESDHVLYMWLPKLADSDFRNLNVTVNEVRIGTSVFPMPPALDEVGIVRRTITNSFGRELLLGIPTFKGLPKAPLSLQIPVYTPRFVLQALIENPQAKTGSSLTNAVTVEIVP